MLLYIMALSGDIAVDHSPRTQSDSGRLALGRVGLLGLRDTDFQADALELWGARGRHGWRGLLTCALGLAAPVGNLVERCEDGGGGGEWANGRGEVRGERGDGRAEDRGREEAPY